MADCLLLIDSDADVLRALGDYFERSGYEVYRAAAAAAGVETVERVRPDVVILDLHLPGRDVLEVLERLRGQGASVILLIGHGDIEIAVRAMQLGAENFLTKPVDLTHLAAATARAAEKARLARHNATLRAVLERAMMSQGTAAIGVERLPAELGHRGGGGDRCHLPQTLAEVERQHIERTLRFHGGNRTRAAQELGISRATLINKIKVYGLDL